MRLPLVFTRRSASALLAIGTIFSALSVGIASADTKPCEAIYKEFPGDKSIASANAWANWRSNAGSISAEAGRLLSAAEKELEKLSQPTDLCPAECRASEAPRIIFKSIPTKYLSEYSDRAKCAALLTRTQSAPLLYPGRKFTDMAALNGWFSEFSQGNGADGKDLYSRCDGDCSPQYSCHINKISDGTLTLDARVICGHARDKDQNTYELSYTFRWECLPK